MIWYDMMIMQKYNFHKRICPDGSLQKVLGSLRIRRIFVIRILYFCYFHTVVSLHFICENTVVGDIHILSKKWKRFIIPYYKFADY